MIIWVLNITVMTVRINETKSINFTFIATEVDTKNTMVLLKAFIDGFDFVRINVVVRHIKVN